MAEINASDYFKAGGNTVANLVGITPDQDGVIYNAVSFFNDWVVAESTPREGGRFVFDKTRPKSDHNGSTIISPTVPWNGQQSTLAAFEAKTGETDIFGRGCWVAVNPGAISGGGGGGGATTIVVSGSRSLSNTDNGGTLVYNGAGNITLTVPSGLEAAFSCTVVQAGTGLIAFAQGGGVGFDNIGSTRGQGTFTTIVQVSTDQYGFQNPVPAGPVTMMMSAIPFISFSSWTFGSNGALTLAVALPTAYPAAYVYFPADAIATGVPAGWYYTTFSTTTAGTVFNNRYTSGQPVIPASPTAFATSAGSVVAQVTSAVTAVNFTLPGGSLGINGQINTEALWQSNNSAQTKQAAATLNLQNMAAISMSTSNLMSEIDTKTLNTGVVNRQITRTATINSTTGTPSYLTVDTTQDQAVAMTQTLGSAATGDYVILLRVKVSAEYRG